MITIPTIPPASTNTIKTKARSFTFALLATLTFCASAIQAFALDEDLAVTGFSAFVPGVIAPGAHLTSFTYSVHNFGPSGGTSAILIDLWLSSNIIFGDGDDLPMGQMQFSLNLPAGSDSTITHSNMNGLAGFTIPAGANGTYRVFLRMTHAPTSGRIDPDLSDNVGLLSDAVVVNAGFINHAPAGADRTITMLEDGIFTFAEADFGFSDPNDLPPNTNTFLAVKVTTLPTTGTLTNFGFAVSAGAFISRTNIIAGRLKFTPAANANGASYANFTFQVQDNGGIANGGVISTQHLMR